MENRFGAKDFFVLLVMLALIVLVIVAMRQYDRQYQHVLTIKQQNDQLAAEVARIRRQVTDITSGAAPFVGSQGQAGDLPVGPNETVGGVTGSNESTDAFTHIKAAERKPDFARGGWLIDNFGTKVGRLTPYISTDVYQSWIENQVMESLAIRDPYSLEFVPRVARRWDISEDGLTMTFHLREDVTFSDGHPLTADDVVFTFDWIMNPEVNAPRTRAYMTQFQDVKKLNDYTVQFTFKELYFKNFETAATVNIMPKHFYSKFTPNQFNERVGLLMGSGPYMLENPENWTPGNGVVLLRNPRYWGVEPTFDRIVFNEIQEESAEMVRYGNQQHDLIRCTPEVYERLIHDQRIMSFSNNFRYTSPYSGYSYIGWNQKKKVGGRDVQSPFADRRVRLAMTMLIDRERMAREIYLGYATVASGPFAPNGPQADPEIKPWPYDDARARQLLKECGSEDRNGDGVVEGPDSKPFKFTLTYPGGAEIYEKIILFLRDNLARGGIIMEPERLDWPVLINKLNNSDFDAVILGWSSVPESDTYQVFHSDQIKDQGDNRTSYSNPALDQAIEQARGTMETQQRMQYWHEVHRILHEDQPYTFLFNRDALRLMNKRIHNIEVSKVGLNFEYLNGGMIPWFIPTEQQKMVQ